ncbi:PRC-barrel domain-containing protein [Dactylosporangium sp. CA-052675]|uniref:PRC-barrel domain-containing protein n=1 Tax=Dactylosporangium sp. CA-052675 TaxID=3239927 RepID=UPI003D8AC303
MQPITFLPWAWRETFNADAADPRFPEEHRNDLDLSGYRVEAVDGHIGSIDRASYEVGNSWVVVDTGPWIFGRKVLLPAGTVRNVDHAERKVYVDRTKDQIKRSPEYDEHTFGTDDYRRQVGDYYTTSYRDEQEHVLR